MSEDLTQAPGYPADIDPSSPRRRRTVLIVVAVGCVVAAGIALGLVIGMRDSGEDTSGLQIAESPEPLQTLAVPPGCELLTPGQLARLVPGTPTKIGRGPEDILGATESACDWANAATDPADPTFQHAALEVKVTAAVDEDAARSTLQISLPCKGSDSKQATVSGADEACLSHKTPDKKRGRADVATVAARYQTLVVEVSYERPSWPGWRVDDQSEVTAAALIGRVVQSQ